MRPCAMFLLTVLWAGVGPAQAAAGGQRLSAAGVEASSMEGENFAPRFAVDGDPGTRWSSQRTDREWIAVDLGAVLPVGRVVLDWETACARMYQLQGSRDGRAWHVLAFEKAGEPGRKEFELKPVELRFLRMYGLKRSTEWGYSLYAFEAYAADAPAVPLEQAYPSTREFRYDPRDLPPRDFYVASAEVAPPGYYPLWVGHQQGYWTITGTERGFAESLMSEDGMIEPYWRSWSVMPYLRVGSRLVTARDVRLAQFLQDGYLPIPTVRWELEGLRLDQTMFTWGGPDAETTYVIYRLENTGAEPCSGSLFLTFRPFQVSPSWQGDGGMVDIFSLRMAYDGAGRQVLVNESQLWHGLTVPDRYGAVSYLEGDVMDYLARGETPPHKTVFDPWGGATGAWEYRFDLGPGDSAEWIFAAPLGRSAQAERVTPADVRAALVRCCTFWRENLNRVQIQVPEARWFDLLRANLAYLFINRDGPALQPGPRHYARSWIRDATLMGLALLRTGYPEDVRDYVEWIADRQLFTGEIPCMINADGSMWHWGKTLPEYDGQGAFVTLVGAYGRYTGDRTLLERRFTNVVKALKFVEHLRGQRLTDEFKNATDERARFYGLLPLSVSHEGYAMPGKHSYWDDFWALRGHREARAFARALGREEVLSWIHAQESDLRNCLHRSLRLTQEAFQADYIPGCAELGEFDPCSPAICVWPTEEHKHLPPEQVRRTFEKYYEEILRPRLRGPQDAAAGYVPYEMKLAGVFFILGEREKGWDVLRHFASVTRPEGWNQWAEVVYPDPRHPGYIGDMPHSWAGADFINSLMTAFVYDEDNRLVLGAGLREEWLAREPTVSAQNLPTPWGRVTYTIERRGEQVQIVVMGTGAPPEGFVFRSPVSRPIRAVTLNGEPWKDFSSSEVRFSALPAEIVLAF